MIWNLQKWNSLPPYDLQELMRLLKSRGLPPVTGFSHGKPEFAEPVEDWEAIQDMALSLAEGRDVEAPESTEEPKPKKRSRKRR